MFHRHLLLPSIVAILVGGIAATAGFRSAAAKPEESPSRPQFDSDVVAKLRPGALSAAERETRQVRLDLAKNPTNLPLALSFARRCVQRARDEADPRQLGAAMTALAPWWSDPEPGPDVRVLRATVQQSLHEFEPAVRDLEDAVRENPRHTQAWLTLSTLYAIRGQFQDARRAALQLGRLSDPFTSLTLAAQIASLTGHAAQAQSSLNELLSSGSSGTSPHLMLWAETLAAEISDRRGDFTSAEIHFRRALDLRPRDPYLLATFSDFLLDQGRRGEAAERLLGWEHADALLLRRVEASGDPTLARKLGDRLDAAFARGERLHLREAARFELHTRHNPERALDLAIENWAIQREPPDVRILFEAATAARNKNAMETVRIWMESTRLEDIHIPYHSATPHL
ncbi:MAG: hypothetical protein U1G08_12045 [Verrucomicrobiota bacterium]